MILLKEIETYKHLILKIFNKCIEFEHQRVISDKENIILYNQLLEENKYLRDIKLDYDFEGELFIDQNLNKLFNTKHVPERNTTEIKCISITDYSEGCLISEKKNTDKIFSLFGIKDNKIKISRDKNDYKTESLMKNNNFILDDNFIEKTEIDVKTSKIIEGTIEFDKKINEIFEEIDVNIEFDKANIYKKLKSGFLSQKDNNLNHMEISNNRFYNKYICRDSMKNDENILNNKIEEFEIFNTKNQIYLKEGTHEASLMNDNKDENSYKKEKTNSIHKMQKIEDKNTYIMNLENKISFIDLEKKYFDISMNFKNLLNSSKDFFLENNQINSINKNNKNDSNIVINSNYILESKALNNPLDDLIINDENKKINISKFHIPLSENEYAYEDILEKEKTDESNSAEFCEIENLNTSMKDKDFDIFSFSNFRSYKLDDEQDINENQQKLENQDFSNKINKNLKRITDIDKKINIPNNNENKASILYNEQNKTNKNSKNANTEKILFSTECTTLVGENFLKDSRILERELIKSRNKNLTSENTKDLVFDSNLFSSSFNFQENFNDTD